MYENNTKWILCSYFELIDPQVDNAELFREKLFELEILRPDDTEEEIVLPLLWFTFFYKPFQSETFDFSDEVFLKILLIRGTLCQRPKSQKDEWKSWIQAFYLH
jgi:hypothetical protein